MIYVWGNLYQILMNASIMVINASYIQQMLKNKQNKYISVKEQKLLLLCEHRFFLVTDLSFVCDDFIRWM